MSCAGVTCTEAPVNGVIVTDATEELVHPDADVPITVNCVEEEGTKGWPFAYPEDQVYVFAPPAESTTVFPEQTVADDTLVVTKGGFSTVT